MPQQTVDIAMADHSLQLLFDEAVVAIQNTISEEDRRTFQQHADVDTFLEDLRSLCSSDQKEQQRLLACTKKMASFAKSFVNYFDIVGLMVPVRPEWPGWLWGLLRLVFQAGSNYVLFLEQACDMIKAIGHGLPNYLEIKRSCRHQFQASQSERLALLSYVYADIVRFCLELYCLFTRGSQGARLRHSITSLGRPLDSRYIQLQQRLSKHRRWLAKGLPDSETVTQQEKEYLDYLHAEPETSGEGEAERMARRMRRVDKVKSWLSFHGGYRDVYEHRMKQRHKGSCGWFLNTPEYCKWKNTPFDERHANHMDSLNANWHERVLFIQAPPGYGKTVLSTKVIEDLAAEAEDLNISDEPPSTAFFHFNAAHLDCTNPTDAFRALTAQLIHTHRHNRSTLDALSLLMRKTTSNEKATSDDVMATLSLLLRQHSTFLVIDGIDECDDPELLLTMIPELCRRSDARVILFSRPEIRIPLQFQKWASDSPHIVALGPLQNGADIEAYLIENLTRMADQGYFGANLDRSHISQIASRAGGGFLWASLLLKYLQSPQLSPDERRAALEQGQLLGGVGSLYRLMLMALDRQTGEDKRVAADVFRWLSSSINRLCKPKLLAALAITSSTPTTPSLNLAELIPRVTCDLVEVTECSMVFAHRSVREYLQSVECSSSTFSLVDDSLVHGHLAARCLSYLANVVPRQPLQRLQPHIRPAGPPTTPSSGASTRTESSGDSGYKSVSSTSDTDAVVTEGPQAQPTPAFDANMPFLRYAALCWPIHLTRALSNSSSTGSPKPLPQQPSDPFAHLPWLPPLSQFLAERPAVTTWVEASWRYSLPPNLSRLVPLILDIKSETPPATVEGRELRWVVHGLRQLSEALNALRGEYGATMAVYPGLVWQWNSGELVAGVEGFWPVWDERRGVVVEGGV